MCDYIHTHTHTHIYIYRERERKIVEKTNCSKNVFQKPEKAKEFTAAARIMQSSSNELSTLASGKIKCKQTIAAAAAVAT